MAVFIREASFYPYQELELYERALRQSSASYGATAVFVGSMRDFNQGSAVTRMALEYYPGMTELKLEQIVDESRQRWGFLDALIIHRVGQVVPGDPIVLVAVWTAHRGPAFDVCRHIMEELKHRAPFWKKETLKHTERWVESNTDGYSQSSECPPSEPATCS